MSMASLPSENVISAIDLELGEITLKIAEARQSFITENQNQIFRKGFWFWKSNTTVVLTADQLEKKWLDSVAYLIARSKHVSKERELIRIRNLALASEQIMVTDLEFVLFRHSYSG